MSQKKDAKVSKRVTFTTSIDPELIKQLKIYCAVNNLRMNDLLERLISDHLGKEGGSNGISN